MNELHIKSHPSDLIEKPLSKNPCPCVWDNNG